MFSRWLSSVSFFLLCTAPLLAAVDFAHEVVPLLREHCAECHTGTKQKGGVSFNDREKLLAGGENGAVVVPGKSAQSKLMDVISSTDPDVQMPPKGTRLTPAQVAVLEKWITEGAAWEAGFAFQKPDYEPPLRPREVTLPAPVAGRTHPVDRLVDAYLAEHHGPPLGNISDAVFLRRVSLDLIGLLPDPQELAKFIADPSSDKRARMVDALLARDVDYTEHWLSFWNDLLRNDYGGTGFITGGRKQITPWLYGALLGNKRYDQFVKELIAPTPASAGFSEGIKWRGTVSAGQTVEIQFAQSTCQAFLGINMKCASCHDSFVDRWKLNEAYGLAAVVAEKPLEVYRCDKAQGRTQAAAWLFPELGQIHAERPVAERQRELADLLTMPANGRFARTIVNRLWQRMFGRGIVHPVDAMSTPPWSADLLDWLANDFAAHGYDLKHTLALLCKSAAYQSASQVVLPITDDHGYVFAGPRARRLTAEQFVDAVWQLTGAAPTKFDAEVVRRSAQDPLPPAEPNVAVKWIWGDSAAAGKVPAAGETISLRKRFTAPAKLRAAAAVLSCDNEFTLYLNGKKLTASNDWQVVTTVRVQPKAGENELLVVAKNAGSGPNAAGLFADVRFLSLDGKATHLVSDATWEWSPTLPNAQGSFGKATPRWQRCTEVPPVPVWVEKVDHLAGAALLQQFPGGARMVRASLLKSDFLTRTLGRPNRDQIVSLRPNDLSTLEAIDLANGSILAGYLQTGAEKLLAAGGDPVQFLYQHALSRQPTAAEQAVLRQEPPSLTAVEDLLWSICMLPEFQLNR